MPPTQNKQMSLCISNIELYLIYIMSSNYCMLCLGREAGLFPALGGGSHWGVWRAAGEKQFQEADEGVRAELLEHRPQHELSALLGGVRVDGIG